MGFSVLPIYRKRNVLIMNRIQFRDLVKSIVASYPDDKPRQIQTFAVIASNNDYEADNFVKNAKDLAEGDFWQRILEANGNDVNQLSVVYPSVTIANRSETVTPSKYNICQGVRQTWMVEVAAVKDGSDCANYRSMSKLDFDLITQCRWIINQLFTSNSGNNDFIAEDIQINLYDTGKDNLRLAEFSVSFESNDIPSELP